MTKQKSRFESAVEAILWALATVLLFDGLTGSLINGDDAIYADMARTAWNKGEFLGLTWHDTVLHEKPPILFLSVGFFGGVMGFSDLVVRLPCVVAAFLSLLVFRGILRDQGYSRLVQWIGVLLLLSSSTFVFHSRRVMADPLFLFFMLGFIWAWLRLQILPVSGKPRTMWAVAGICLGLAVLTKWIFAILPVLAVMGWHLGRFEKPRFKDMFWVAIIAFVIAAPWHIMQSLEYGTEFWKTYAGYHVLARASESLVAPQDSALYFRTLLHNEALLLLGLVPTVFFMVRSRGVALRRSATPLVMLALVFAPIQLSQTRIEHYLLPILPLLVLAGLEGWSRLIDIRRILMLVPILLALVVITLSVRPISEGSDYSPGSHAACKAGTFDDPGVLVVNAYNVAATWYCRRPIKILTDDKGFYEIQQSVDMMYRSKAVTLMEPLALDSLMRSHTGIPIVTRPGYGVHLLERLSEERPRALAEYLDADVLYPAPKVP
jgi:4-amino-4-deoxy-L-arabinose transferase-like glycosyltransferase